MGVAVKNKSLVWKIMFSDLLCDTCLQSTFNGVTKQVVRSRESTRIKKSLRVGDSEIGQSLMIPSVHSRESLHLTYF